MDGELRLNCRAFTGFLLPSVEHHLEDLSVEAPLRQDVVIGQLTGNAEEDHLSPFVEMNGADGSIDVTKDSKGTSFNKL